MKSLLAVTLCSTLASCAWTNPDNRPVWNAFEKHVVPEDDTWFALTLPLTAPAGLLAVVTDTLIVHPAQVVGGAADDAMELWTDDGPNWDDSYYTEMAGLPFRAAATPTWFLFSFLGRSMFDFSPAQSDEATATNQQPEPEIDPAVQMRSWLDEIAAGAADTYSGPHAPWTDQLTASLQLALERANANGRFKLYEFAIRGYPPIDVLAPTAGLRDRDPVVRYRQLLTLPVEIEVDDELAQALKSDPVESIRLVAERRFAVRNGR